ncbi:MAG: 5-aminovalerate aminotransferase DavT [Chloroflexi bacterium]|nr:5-aminovalerate aminotransferase DavT [Chloroflexota bacterium]
MKKRKAPHLVESIPGPNAEKYLAQNEAFVSGSLPHVYPLVVKKAQGCIVEDVDGNRYLDFASGIAVCSTGHCHPKVVEAIKSQTEKLIHICGADFYDPQYISLAERLAKLAPGDSPKKVFLGNSGAEAVEAALKLARYHTGRSHAIAFFGAFHGRTLGAVSLTASKPIYHKGFGPLLPSVTHAPYGYCYRCPYNLTHPECDLACVDYIENTLFAHTIDPTEVAAIFVEPIQGEGGYIVPPAGWLAKIRALCDRYGIMLVDDEVQAGIGRTGKMFAAEHWNVEPDIICSAKALGSGMPISAMIAKEEVMTWPPGAHGSTYGGNPVACAAAHATLDVIEEEGLTENATRVGGELVRKLQDLQKSSQLIGDVRGLGLMIGVELVTDTISKQRAKKEVEKVIQESFQRGLITLPCGPNTIRFAPPLNITVDEMNVAYDIFAEALAYVESEMSEALRDLTSSLHDVAVSPDQPPGTDRRSLNYRIRPSGNTGDLRSFWVRGQETLRTAG